VGDVRVTQGFVQAATADGGDVRVSQAYVLAATQFPSEEVQSTQDFVQAAVLYGNEVQVTQAYVLAAVRGRVYDPRIRAWTFTLDGHDYYVLRLGVTTTLVYDTHSEQWYVWGNSDSDLWNAYHGTNWIGAGYSANVIVGDDIIGSIYHLDPDADTDDDRSSGSDVPRQFLRQVTGQVIKRGYDVAPCFEVQLLGSIGNMSNTDLVTVTLETSDDSGHTYDSHGAVTIDNTDYTARASWLSLGSIAAPGRLFRISDYGTLKRIDSLEIPGGD
jgi:hypothetical protein